MFNFALVRFLNALSASIYASAAAYSASMSIAPLRYWLFASSSFSFNSSGVMAPLYRRWGTKSRGQLGKIPE